MQSLYDCENSRATNQNSTFFDMWKPLETHQACFLSHAEAMIEVLGPLKDLQMPSGYSDDKVDSL